ncbi:outer membrane beta-barrel protein [Gilliamella sp. Pra-s65]|uniref:outer membrane protein n=1 Tax=unclassified Gilliamella TaxID=2685620 RepID=UPI001365C50F|nr:MULTISPECIES: outer membrane protein [unclassified Gilliamella]MWN89707.1 outer membrane beta-barrel protein [Gilliamella sp. Pra-s65]MWP47232.1 outer membrane beta-barrel protein [Gilliamella sp. Pas-s27]MWP72715.1 outer membrane beta-barrel protein [Gilliamella sp. Pra-s52]
MKKTLIALTTLVGFSGLAHAENGFYLGGQLGASVLGVSNFENSLHYGSRGVLKDDLFDSMHKTKLAGALNLGYNFSDYDIPVRAELSFTLRGNAEKKENRHNTYEDYTLRSTQKTKARMNTLMLNGYYDIDMDSVVTPFIGVGLGVAFTKLGNSHTEKYNVSVDGVDYERSLSKTKTKFAWNLAAGVAYKVNNNINIDFTARYVDAGKVTIKKRNEYYQNKISGDLSSVDLLAGIRYSF